MNYWDEIQMFMATKMKVISSNDAAMKILEKKVEHQAMTKTEFYVIRQNDTNLRNRIAERDGHIQKCYQILGKTRNMLYEKEMELKKQKSKYEKMGEAAREQLKEKEKLIEELLKERQSDRQKISVQDDILFDHDLDLTMDLTYGSNTILYDLLVAPSQSVRRLALSDVSMQAEEVPQALEENKDEPMDQIDAGNGKAESTAVLFPPDQADVDEFFQL